MFRNPFRSNEISLNRIHHTVTVNENGEKLKLVVNADPMRLVAGLTKAQQKLAGMVKDDKEPTEDEIRENAEYFSSILFGREQTKKLMEFYAGDAPCVINVCGQIFKKQLADKISKAQKKMRV